MLSRFGTLAEFGTLASLARWPSTLLAGWPIVDLASSINIPQWDLTKVHSRRIGNKPKKKENLQKQVKITNHRRSEPWRLDVTISALRLVRRKTIDLVKNHIIGILWILPYKHVSRSFEIWGPIRGVLISRIPIIFWPNIPYPINSGHKYPAAIFHMLLATIYFIIHSFTGIKT